VSDKLKIQQDKDTKLGGNNVIHVPPRLKTVRHRGLHGKIEFHPRRGVWSYILKLLYPVTHGGEKSSEAEATLELKKLIDTAAGGNNKHVRSTD
jgi:hypothetical protein